MLSCTRAFGERVGYTVVRALAARYAASSTVSALSEKARRHIVVALGGNALLKRGEAMTMGNQRKNIAEGMASLGKLVRENSVTLVHGNGPQVGLLLLESATYEQQTGLETISLDVLDAETEGMIGYLIEQELQRYLPEGRGMATMLSQIVCDRDDPAFANPTKFVGPVYSAEEADRLKEKGLPLRADGDKFRRVVPSPLPVKLVDHEMRVLQHLTAANHVVICGGGGGIPVCAKQDRDSKSPSSTGITYEGVEAVIDKDRAAAMLAHTLQAQGLLILTDVPAVALDFGKPNARQIQKAHPNALHPYLPHFPAGSMGPKIESAIEFVIGHPKGVDDDRDQSSVVNDRWAAIGALSQVEEILSGQAGTLIRADIDEKTLDFYDTS